MSKRRKKKRAELGRPTRAAKRRSILWWAMSLVVVLAMVVALVRLMQ